MSVVTASLLPEAPRRRADEEALQRSVVQFLRWALPGNAVCFHVPNGGPRHGKARAILAGLGLRAGIPDLMLIYSGTPIAIELKTPKGALSAVQRQMHDKLRLCGADVLVCRSLDGVEQSLLELGVPLKARLP